MVEVVFYGGRGKLAIFFVRFRILPCIWIYIFHELIVIIFLKTNIFLDFPDSIQTSVVMKFLLKSYSHILYGCLQIWISYINYLHVLYNVTVKITIFYYFSVYVNSKRDVWNFACHRCAFIRYILLCIVDLTFINYRL